MKSSISLLLAGICTVGCVCAVAATQADSLTQKDVDPPFAVHQSRPVKTADFGWATPDLAPLESQTVQSQGGSLRPGPHNRHLNPPHGGSVHSGDRGDMPGRS
jgi:hypothetical protein